MRELGPTDLPITYLISDGTLTDQTFPEKSLAMLETLRIAGEAGVSLFQIREKQLSARNVFELALEAARIAQDSNIKIIVNDRADIAAASSVSGVQLTETSLPNDIIRGSFPDLIVGVSTHSTASVVGAAMAGADFAVFGPVFETPGKENPQGLGKLRLACDAFPNFPIIAIGGIDQSNLRGVLEAGATGFAAIRFLNDGENLRNIKALMAEIRI